MREHSNKQEKRVSKFVGGRKKANSGATPFDPGDVELDDALIECKTKAKPSKSITLKEKFFRKIREEATLKGKPFAFVTFSFDNITDYYSMDANQWKALYQAYRTLERIIAEALNGEINDLVEDDELTLLLKWIIREEGSH